MNAKLALRTVLSSPTNTRPHTMIATLLDALRAFVQKAVFVPNTNKTLDTTGFLPTRGNFNTRVETFKTATKTLAHGSS
jgi:hypothetical protein